MAVVETKLPAGEKRKKLEEEAKEEFFWNFETKENFGWYFPHCNFVTLMARYKKSLKKLNRMSTMKKSYFI